MVDGKSADLLGRHVGRRSQDYTRLAEMGFRFVARHGWRLEFREAKVENLDAALARDEQILWFQIAMHDASGVCGGKTMRDLNSVVDDLAGGSAPSFSFCRSVSPSAIPRRCRNTLLNPAIMNHQYVRMIERARGTRFEFEPA